MKTVTTFADALEDPNLGAAIVQLVQQAAGGRQDFAIVLIVHSAEGQSMINNIIDREELAVVLEGAAEKARNSMPNATIKPTRGH